MVLLVSIFSATLLNMYFLKKSIMGNKHLKLLVTGKPKLLLNDHVFFPSVWLITS